MQDVELIVPDSVCESLAYSQHSLAQFRTALAKLVNDRRNGRKAWHSPELHGWVCHVPYRVQE